MQSPQQPIINPATAQRLCYFAHYHPAGIVSVNVLHYLAALRRAGFSVVVATTASLDAANEGKLRLACDDLIRRDNVGLDFGSWAACHAKWPPHEAEFLLLCNDSVYGPLGDLGDCFDRLTAIDADFYGMVASCQFGWHIQSWFLLLRPRAYRSPPFVDLIANPVVPGLPKPEIIRRYELGLSRRLTEAGLRGHALYDAKRDGMLSRQLAINPAQHLWRELVDDVGVPFIKIEVIRDNPMALSNVGEWRQVVAAHHPDWLPQLDRDIAQRRAASAGLASSHPRSREGPELRPFLARDMRSSKRGARLVMKANMWLFRVARALGRAKLRASAWLQFNPN